MKLMLTLLVSLVALAQQPPTRILVAYDSDTGNIEKLAQSIRTGAAAVVGVEVTLRKTTPSLEGVRAGDRNPFARTRCQTAPAQGAPVLAGTDQPDDGSRASLVL